MDTLVTLLGRLAVVLLWFCAGSIAVKNVIVNYKEQSYYWCGLWVMDAIFISIALFKFMLFG